MGNTELDNTWRSFHLGMLKSQEEGRGRLGQSAKLFCVHKLIFPKKNKKKASCLIIEHKPVQNKNGSR